MLLRYCSKDADFVEVVISVVWFPYGRDTDGVDTDWSEVGEIERYGYALGIDRMCLWK